LIIERWRESCSRRRRGKKSLRRKREGREKKRRGREVSARKPRGKAYLLLNCNSQSRFWLPSIAVRMRAWGRVSGNGTERREEREVGGRKMEPSRNTAFPARFPRRVLPKTIAPRANHKGRGRNKGRGWGRKKKGKKKGGGGGGGGKGGRTSSSLQPSSYHF